MLKPSHHVPPQTWHKRSYGFGRKLLLLHLHSHFLPEVINSVGVPVAEEHCRITNGRI
jgi:hypothetical protein